ncbi:MAG TPA: hypothetical protein VJU61_23940, partial [Polyangiaceae bacterium]|nr:hypothetical protein [Polyangiaceae bacterium]
MTRPSSSLPLQPACARQRHRASLLGCSLGCLVAGCAERYDIGEFRDTTLLQTGDVAPAGIGVLLADGIEDADALLEGVRFLSSTSGDLDGDGFDDLVVAGTELPTSLHILYGGPRPSDRVVRLARRSSALGLDEYYYSASPDGDFDRDGADDLVVSARDRGFYEYGLSGTAAAEQEVEWANLVQRWTEMRAFLWNGRPERPAQLEFPGDAAAFRAGDDLSSNLARVLEEHAPNEFA